MKLSPRFSNVAKRQEPTLEEPTAAYLHESPRHVPRLCSFHSRVNQTLSTAHGVEEELVRCHPTVEGIGHETLRSRGSVCRQSGARSGSSTRMSRTGAAESHL